MMKKQKKQAVKTFQTRVPLRLKRPAKALFQSKVDSELLAALRPVLKENRMTMAAVVEWGMREFLAHADPKTARALHIELNAS